MWKKIKLILWKSLQIRKRNIFRTIMEILLPCLILYLIYFLIDNIKQTDENSNKIVETVPSPISKELIHKEFTKNHASNYFIYSPKNNQTDQIMKIVATNLEIPFDNIETTDNEDEMITKFKIKSKSSKFNIFMGFGIVFQQTNISNGFKYKIRCTHHTFSVDTLFPPHLERTLDSGKNYLNEGFLSLQLTLDEAFITWSLSNDNKLSKIDYNLQIQSYPYVTLGEETNIEENTENICIFTVVAFLFMCIFTIKSISEEKESGVKELMKMMGLKPWMLWMGWILHNLLLYLIVISFITYIFCFGFFYPSNHILLNHSNPYLFWIFFMMYMVAGTFFCFAITSLFNKAVIAMVFGALVWVLSYFVPNYLWNYISIIVKTLLMIIPNVALMNGINSIFSLESQRKGLNLSTLFTTGNEHTHFCVGFVLIMFIVQYFLYGFIAWYFDLVKPGVYGIAKPFYFLCNIKSNITKKNNMAPINNNNSALFENPSRENEIGISVQNLHKHFGDFRAVNGVNLDLYKGKITVLLGHNGAGKTTTMSIITGLISPSYGRVEFYGKDIFSNIEHFREHLGLCPQHNLLFPYLTARDHLIFFGMLKGMTLKEAKSESLNLLKSLNILKKQNLLVSKLSGGMKRKVSLAIALIGNSDILILDEPTSGMDPESRREMWDLLLSFRGTRTILITTHFMEEADVLGDQIAIMDHGQVKCYGSTIFLKKALGAGYNLTIVKDEKCSESNIIAEIKKIIPKAEIQKSLAVQIIVNLPDDTVNNFPNLFKMLESNRTKLCIKGMGISCTSMEDVFLSISKSKDIDGSAEQFNRDNSKIITTKYKSKIRLWTDQFKVLFKKNRLYTCRRWPTMFILGIIPILLGIFTISITNTQLNQNKSFGDEYKELEMSLNIYKNSNVYYRTGKYSDNNLEPIFVSISKRHQSVVYEASSENDTIINDLLKMRKRDEINYKMNLMIAGDFNDTDLTIIYNSVAIHTPAIAVNLYTNALLQKISKNNESYISTINEPINLKDPCFIGDSTDFKLLWLLCFAPAFLFLIGYIPSLPLDERTSGFKHLQMMTNLSPIIYWASCFIWNYLCYIIVVILTLAAMYMFDVYHIFTDLNVICVLLLLLLIYGWCSLFHIFVYSYFTDTLPGIILLFFSINFIIGLIINIVVILFIKPITFTSNKISLFNKYNIIWCISLLIPHFAFSSGLDGFLEISLLNKKCEACSNLNMEVDCSIKKKFFVFRSDENMFGILTETLFLLFSSLLYILLILLFEYKVFSCIYQCGFNTILSTNRIDRDDNEDPDVTSEKEKVNEAKNQTDNALIPLFIADDLVKKYSFNFTAVRGISFTVSSGECFGLLGINGAGKSTAFRMLTGDTFLSRGDASIHIDKVYKRRSNFNKYVSFIGYCPQNDALNSRLTCKETLQLMAVLRGISPSSSKTHVDKWLTFLGLKEYENKVCGNYSGGNKRKLNTAIALIGDPPVVFLDEPTSGVDPVSRHKLWQVMADSRRDGQAVILTSHSMDECEALCNRLTVMVDGQMKCIGNIQYLKTRYGQGFTVMIKLRSSTNVAKIKADIERQFAPDITLKDQHQGMLHYHIINPQIPLSVIFTKMIDISKIHAGIEDYTVGDTTLEQVFLAFAKKQAVRHT